MPGILPVLLILRRRRALNKYFTRTAASASKETMYCRHTVQLPFDIVLADLEKTLLVNQN